MISGLSTVLDNEYADSIPYHRTRAYLKDKNGSTWPTFLWQNFCQNNFWNPNLLKIDTRECKWLIFYSNTSSGINNDLDAQSDFDKKNCQKKAGQVETFLS